MNFSRDLEKAGNTWCSKLLLTVLKKLLTTKYVQKPMSKSAIGNKKILLFSVFTMVWLEKYRAIVVCLKPGLHLNANAVCENEAIV